MRKYSRVLLIGLAASPMALVALGATGPGLAITPSGQSAGRANAEAILGDRSPGARRAGTAHTKLARATGPTERVLSQVRERPSPAAPPTTSNLSRAVFESAPLGAPTLVLAPLTNDLSGGAIGGPGGGIGGIGGPAPLFVPISTPGGGSGEGGTPTTPATPPPAVPEPFTWVTLLAGLGLIGWRLRHERSAGSARRAGRLPG